MDCQDHLEQRVTKGTQDLQDWWVCLVQGDCQDCPERRVRGVHWDLLDLRDLQVGRVRGVLRGRLVLRAPQGSQQNGVIQDHLALLVSQELLEVLESEVPLDLKEYKDFQVHRGW